jgi:hypothetical protein
MTASTTTTRRTLGALAALGLGLAGCYRGVMEWPREPLRVVVQVEGCPAGGGGHTEDAGAADAAAAVDAATPADAAVSNGPVPGQATRAKLAGKPLLLAARGRLVYVEYGSGTAPDGVTIFEVDGQGAADCQAGGNRTELWKLSNGRRWDAQVTVAPGRVVCVESSGYAEGDVVWLVR